MLVCLNHQILLSNSEVLLENKQINYYAASQVSLDVAERNIYSVEFIKKALSLSQEIDWLSHNYVEFRGMTWLREEYKSLLINRGFVTKYSRSKFQYHQQHFTEAFMKFYGEEFIQAIQLVILKKPESYLEYYLFSCDITQTIDRITHVLLIKFLCGSIRDVFD